MRVAGVGAGNCAGIHLPEHHAGGFDTSDGGVYGEEFAGGSRVEAVRVVHTESIRDPVEQIAW